MAGGGAGDDGRAAGCVPRRGLGYRRPRPPAQPAAGRPRRVPRPPGGTGGEETGGVVIVTGGAGFIGGNLVAALVARGRDVVVVDELPRAAAEGRVPGGIRDALDKDALLRDVAAGARWLATMDTIVHLGACTDTAERDEDYLFRNNVLYAERLLEAALARRRPFLYASSAAVYGPGPSFAESAATEPPANAYGRSKWLLDQRVRAVLPRARSQVVGLRFFNVYGRGEGHKGLMASMVFRLHATCRRGEPARLFGASGGWGAGEQQRDFVHVSDVVAVTRWFMEHPDRSGIFNVGTGRTTSFNTLARLVLSHVGGGAIEYVPMPPALRGGYQSYTCADLSALRAAGYTAPVQAVDVKVPEYLRELDGARAPGALVHRPGPA